MVNIEVRKLIGPYLTLVIWFLVHNEDKDISTDQFESVLKEIGRLEDEFRLHGVSQSTINKLIDYAEELYKTPIDQLSRPAQLRISKIIFGTQTKWADESRKAKNG